MNLVPGLHSRETTVCGTTTRRASTLLLAVVAVAACVSLFVTAGPAAAADNGDECANAELREAQGSDYLPDCRAWEKVSPDDKNFADIDAATPALGFLAIPAWERDAIYFCAATKFGDHPAADQGFCGSHLAERGEAGWTVKSDLVPYACTYNADAPPAGPTGAMLTAVSRDLKRGTLVHAEGGSCEAPALDPSAPQPSTNMYLRSLTGEPNFQLLTPQHPFSAAYSAFNGDYLGGSDDLSHVVFASTGQQTPDAPAGDFNKIFEWADGTLRLVSKRPDGTAFTTASSLPKNAYNAVSADGSRIIFQNPADNPPDQAPPATMRLYMREDGIETVEVSQSECTDSCGAVAGARFEMATPDGSRVWFTTQERLTDDPTSPGTKLYMYEHSDDPASDENLTLISVDNEPADGQDAGVVAVLNGPSESGDTIFFVTTGQLVAGEDTDPGFKIYRWEADGNPELRYLTTLSPEGDGLSDASSAGWNWYPNWFWAAEFGWGNPSPSSSMNRLVTPNGEFLLIQTELPLDEQADTDSDRDVYRWDEENGWLCASCQPAGVPSNGPSLIRRFTHGSAPSVGRNASSRSPQEAGIAMTDDGRVYFETHDRLVPRDQNGSARDVYEWDDGEFSLITSGRGQRDSYLIGTTPSGENVYFISPERLVGWDEDNLNDIYVARVGGGFPEPDPEPAVCDGDGCQDGPSSSPAEVGPGSSGVFPGNPRAQASSANCARFDRRAKRAERKARQLRRKARRSGSKQRASRLRKRARKQEQRTKKLRERGAACREGS